MSRTHDAPEGAGPRLRSAVLDWYDRHGRDLPWRDPDCTPWGIYLSEVMSQQTPVARVQPVWERWLERWPTPADLAADSPGEAVRMWDRLGYPRRALRLWESAARSAGVGHRSSQRSQTGSTRATGVCWDITSER